MRASKLLLPPALIFSVLVILVSCGDDNYVPKPRGYFRISLPDKEYRKLDSIYPYMFELPVYSKLSPDPQAPRELFWININYPAFRGRIHLSYKEIRSHAMLLQYLEDSRTLVMKHIPKASSIEQSSVAVPQKKVYGLTYNIKGLGAASPYQFYLTDSIRHFIRGALYLMLFPIMIHFSLLLTL
jgi:gliding motility-associated lipoprotein GldD